MGGGGGGGGGGALNLQYLSFELLKSIKFASNEIELSCH